MREKKKQKQSCTKSKQVPNLNDLSIIFDKKKWKQRKTKYLIMKKKKGKKLS